MQWLVEQGKIQKNLFSIYLSNKPGMKTHIKFGGWDKEGLKPGKNLHMIHTNSQKTWLVNFHDLSINDEVFDIAETDVALDPGYPWIHVPIWDWSTVATTINDFFIEEFGFVGEVCQTGKITRCKVNMSCNELKRKMQAQ